MPTMDMALYTVAVGYGQIPDEPLFDDGVTDCVEMTVSAGTAAAAICIAVMEYQMLHGVRFPNDDVVTASVIGRQEKPPVTKKGASKRPASSGTPRRRRARKATTAPSSSGGRGRGDRGRRRA